MLETRFAPVNLTIMLLLMLLDEEEEEEEGDVAWVKAHMGKTVLKLAQLDRIRDKRSEALRWVVKKYSGVRSVNWAMALMGSPWEVWVRSGCDDEEEEEEEEIHLAKAFSYSEGQRNPFPPEERQ